MIKETQYHVFLSHNSDDKEAVEIIAHRLREEAKLHPFLDKWNLIPGQPWQEAIEEALRQSESVAVFIGPSGISPWHNEEMRTALDNAVRTRDEYRVIPVLLPGASPESVTGFLARRTWVDFRSGLDDAEAFQRLVAGIQGEAIDVGAYELPDEPAPYRGLLPFKAEHAEFFFGREADTRRLLDKLRQGTFVAIIGASGSGKSSLVRAGLLPAVTRDALPDSGQWHTLVLTPGGQPLRALAEGLVTFVPLADRLRITDELEDRMATRADGLRTAATTLLADSQQPLLLVIDQFEEVFTLCQEGPERCRNQARQFIANLADTARREDRRILILITLRADFLDRCLAFPQLKDLLQDRQMLLGPLDEPALRDAVVRPAQAVGAYFEKGLVGTILRDVQAQPGALPLLQHALYELWRARRGPWLTLDAYEASGGVSGALQRRAQATYDALTPEQQQTARNIFLRLTALGEGASDTRRRVSRSELYPAGVDSGQVDAVLQALSGPQARLIIADERTVEVAHEAIIQQWSTLREWLEEDRAGLRVHRKLTEAAIEWERNGREESYLYTGARLAGAQEWAEVHAGDLNALERELLHNSISARKQARTQRLALGLAAILLIVAVFALFAIVQGRAAVRERNVAATAQAERDRANSQAQIALSRQLAAQAITAVDRDLDAELSLLLAVEAARSFQSADSVPNMQVDEALRRALASAPQRILRYRLDREQDPASTDYYPTASIEFSPSGKYLLVIDLCSDECLPVRVVDVRTGTEVAPLHNIDGVSIAREFGPNEEMLAVISSEGTLLLLNIRTGERSTKAGTGVYAFSSDDTFLAWATSDGNVQLLDMATAGTKEISLPHTAEVRSIAFGPERKWLTTIDNQGKLHLWNLTEYEEESIDHGNTDIFSVSFSPDGKRLAAVGSDAHANMGHIYVWDAHSGEPIIEHTYENAINCVEFDPTGQWMAINEENARVYVWDLERALMIKTFDGSLFFGCRDDNVYSTFSPNGERIVINASGTMQLWDTVNGEELASFTPDGVLEKITFVTFIPSGNRLAVVAHEDVMRPGTLYLWDTATGNEIASLPHLGEIIDIEIRPFGEEIATISSSDSELTKPGTAYLWNINTGELVNAFRHTHVGGVSDLDISPDGTKLATVGADNTIRVWDLDAVTSKQGMYYNIPTADELNGLQNKSVRAEIDSNKVYIWSNRRDQIVLYHEDAVQALYFNQHNTRIATTTENGTTYLWDATQGEKLAVFPGRAAHVPFSVDGNRLAINTPIFSVMVWDVALHKPLGNFLPEDGTLIDSVLSPDGTRLVTLAGTGFARRHERFATLWDVDGTRELARTNGATVAAFSPDAALVALGGMDGTAHILNAATGEEETAISHEGEVLTLDFSPDGDLLATGGSDGTVRIWDRANAQEMAMLEHEAEVRVVAFNSDGTQLITRDSDGKIYRWLVNVGDLAALACNILTRNFTEEEWNTYIGSEKSYHKSCPDLPDPEEAPAP